MAKRSSDSDSPEKQAKKIKTEETCITKKIIVRNDDDPHVYVKFDSEYAKIGDYIYKVKENNMYLHHIIDDPKINQDKQMTIDDSIGITLAQYDDIRSYIFEKKVMVKKFSENVNKIDKMIVNLENQTSYKIVIQKDHLVNYILKLLNTHIISIDQNFILNYNNLVMYATINEIDNKNMGMVSSETIIDFAFSEYNIIIYDRCIEVDTKSIRVFITKCISLNSNSQQRKSNKSEFPLIVNQSTLNTYVRNAVGDTFIDDETLTYRNGGYEFVFNIKIIDLNKETKYKNTYRFKNQDLLDIRSSTENVIVTEGIKTAEKICFSCHEQSYQKYDTKDYILAVDDLTTHIRENIKTLTTKQSYKYYLKSKREIILSVDYINPRSNEILMYKIDKNTKIVFENDANSKFILVKNKTPLEINKITFKIKKVISGGLFRLFGGDDGEDKMKVLDAKKLEKIIRNLFPEKTAAKHRMKISYKGQNLLASVKDLIFKENTKSTSKKKEKYATFGIITKETEIKFEVPKKEKAMTINTRPEQLANPIKELEKYVGGLSNELEKIVRILCLSRGKLKDEYYARGLHPPKGMIFHGPPGTGKTTIARHLGKIFGCDGERFRLISGPEMFNMWFGESEKNIREIFKPAKEAWKKYGSDSPLYMVVIDEIDALLPVRKGSSNTSVRDSLVNQFLAEIDGLVEFHNFICIGLTNKLELLDPAAIRPGRLGTHIKIDLPNKDGRLQIFQIHAKELIEQKKLDRVDFEKLADLTDTFSGADIEGIVELASTYSLERLDKLEEINENIIDQKGKVTQDDFVKAINELRSENKRDDKIKYNHMYL